MNGIEKKKREAPSVLLKNVKKDCVCFQYFQAVKRLESLQNCTTYEKKLHTQFVKKSLHVIFNAICLDAQWEKYVAYFIKCHFHQWPILERIEPLWCVTQLIKNQLVSCNLDTKEIKNMCSKSREQRNELIQLTIRYLQSSKQWTFEWNWSRWLLLMRLLPLLKNLQIVPDAHIILSLLHCSIKASLPINIQGILLSCLLATASFPTSFSQQVSMLSCHSSSVPPKKMYRLWEVLNQTLFLSSSDTLEALNLSTLSSGMKGIQGSIKNIACFLNETTFPSHHFTDISFLGSFANRLSQCLYKNQFTFSQIVSSKFIPTLYKAYEWMSLLSVFLFEKPSQLLKRAFQYHKGIDGIHKIPHLIAIEQAILCSRERHRHGACLIQSSLENNHLIQIVSKGRNQGYCLLENALLLQQMSQSTLVDLRLSTPSLLPFENPSKIHSIYIVELDDYDIGYCDAQACPLCTTALEKVGVSKQYYSTPYGIRYETFPFLPNVKAPTLDFVFKTRIF
ncbi:uncharacterized protein LOC128882928 isoform X2 [Hylaeus volcanicus]|uniref:uncharacterized protein LOC128882928 isoform X2 n=1 Tax=Hylaeus volcanicus TaxID=313075 RepID=UPI0023B7969B|nr:uncharacterized protein LOC128882928 isoform X2 [Hylaeus volcanicus]